MITEQSINIILASNRTFLCCRPSINVDMLEKLKALLILEHGALNFQDFKYILERIPTKKKPEFIKLFTADEFAAMIFDEAINEKIYLFIHILPVYRVLYVVDALTQIERKESHCYTSFHQAPHDTWLLQLLGANRDGAPFITLVKGLRHKADVLTEFALSSAVKLFGEHYKSTHSPLTQKQNINAFLNQCCDIHDLYVIDAFINSWHLERISSLQSIDRS